MSEMWGNAEETASKQERLHHRKLLDLFLAIDGGAHGITVTVHPIALPAPWLRSALARFENARTSRRGFSGASPGGIDRGLVKPWPSTAPRLPQ